MPIMPSMEVMARFLKLPHAEYQPADDDADGPGHLLALSCRRR